MIRVQLKTFDPLPDLEEKAWRGLQRAVVFYHSQLLLVLNKSNPRPYKTPSAPGEAPRKRVGYLQRNVLFELNAKDKSARVGITVQAKYGAFLELGTKRGLKPRPFMLPTLTKLLPQLQALIRSEL